MIFDTFSLGAQVRLLPRYTKELDLLSISNLINTFRVLSASSNQILGKFLNQLTFTCSNSTIETLEWRRSGAFVVNFEHISHFFLVFPLLTLNK